LVGLGLAVVPGEAKLHRSHSPIGDSGERVTPMRENEGSPGQLRVNAGLAIPIAEIAVRTSRSSGPGGQHANVTASRVEAVFDVLASTALSETQRTRVLARAGPRVVAVAQDSRSQLHNRELAFERLGERLAQALAQPKRRRSTRPTAASRERRLQAKRRSAERKRQRRPPESS
jgi:ribosome-associated protein